jgi:hypothetical protein
MEDNLWSFLYVICCFATAMIDYHMSGSGLEAIFAFMFAPFFWAYWLLTYKINITIIKETFAFFLKQIIFALRNKFSVYLSYMKTIKNNYYIISTSGKSLLGGSLSGLLG